MTHGELPFETDSDQWPEIPPLTYVSIPEIDPTSSDNASRDQLQVQRELLPDKERKLGELASARIAYDAAKKSLNTKVEDARTSGATWSEIGAATKITTQNAHQRWSAKGRATHFAGIRRARARLRDGRERE